MLAGSLEIQLMAEVGRLRTDMAEAKRVVSSTMEDVSRMANMAKTALGAIGAGISLGAFVQMARHAADAADELYKLSQKSGIAVAELSSLKYAATLSDVSLESLGKGIKGLSQKMVEATDTTGKAGQIMKALGVDVQGGAMPAIEKLADAFAKLPDGPTKAALAVEVFGKAGMDMIPLLNQGSEGIRKMREEALRLGLVMDEDTAKAAETFNDNLKVVQMSGERLGASLLNALAPSLVRVTQAMKEAAADSGVLAALWVGLGGIASEALGMNRTEAERQKKDLREMQAELVKMQAIMASGGKDLGIGVTDRSGLVAARKRVEELTVAIAILKAQMDKTWKPNEGGAFDFGGPTSGAANKDLEAKVRGLLGLGAAGEKAAKKMKDLGDANAHVTTELEHSIKMAKISNDEVQKAIDLEERQRQAKEAAAGAFGDAVKQMEFEVTLLGKSNAEREIAIRLRALEKAGIDTNTESVAKYVERIRAAYAAQDDFRAQQEAMRTQVSVWTDLSRTAADFFVDLATNGREAFSNLREWAKQFLAQMLAIFAQKWILNLGASLVGGSGGGALSTAAGQVGQGTLTGAASNYIGSLLTGTGTVGTAIGQTGIMQLYGGATGAIQGPGLTGAAGLGQQATGWASANLGALGIVGAIIAVGMWAMDLYKSGWRDTGSARDNAIATGGFSGIQQVDNRLLKMLGFSDRDAFTMSGGPIISRLFGWKQRQNDAFGVRGTFGPGGITGEQWQDWSQQGGLFRSDRRGTDTAAFSTEQSAFFASVFKGIGDIVGSVGRAIGANPAAILSGYSKPFNFQLNENGDPLSDEALQKLFGDYFGGVLQEQVAMVFDAGGRGELAEYVKALKGSGEEVTNLIAELLGVMGALDQSNILGMKVEDLMKFQQEGETLTQTFQRVGGAWAQFQDLFYTDAEKIAAVQDQVAAVFADLGIAVPTSNEEFRRLVESIDVTTESGRKMFLALTGVAPAFRTITNAAEAAVTRFNSLATTLSPSFGAANARSVLEARVRSWMGLTPGNGAAGGWDVESTIANIGTLVREGRIGEALTYAQSLGGNAVTVLNDMLEAYIAWTTAMQNAQGPVTSVGTAVTGLGDAAARAAAQMQGAKDGLWAYLQGLLVNTQLSPLGPAEMLREARGQFFEQLRLAQGGDVGAASGLQGYIDRVLTLGRDASGSGSAYIQLFREITSAAADFAKPGGAKDLQRDMYMEARTGNDLMRDVRQILLDIRDRGTADGDKVADTVENAAVSTAMR